MTTTMVTVVTTPPTANPAIYSYKASVNGASPAKECTVKASESVKQCVIAGLAPNTEYTISTQACMPGAFGCGAVVSDDTRTFPNRTLNDFNTSCKKHLLIASSFAL